MKAKVNGGPRNNPRTVTQEAMRFRGTHEQWVHKSKLAQLREQLRIGINQLDRGLEIPVGSNTELDTIFSEIEGEPKA